MGPAEQDEGGSLQRTTTTLARGSHDDDGEMYISTCDMFGVVGHRRTPRARAKGSPHHRRTLSLWRCEEEEEERRGQTYRPRSVNSLLILFKAMLLCCCCSCCCVCVVVVGVVEEEEGVDGREMDVVSSNGDGWKDLVADGQGWVGSLAS
jgi:hypothetical protein